MLRRLDDYGPWRRAYVTLARTTGAALDRLEADPKRSEHTLGSVARVHARCLEALRPSPSAIRDPLEVLAAELAAAVQDSSSLLDGGSMPTVAPSGPCAHDTLDRVGRHF